MLVSIKGPVPVCHAGRYQGQYRVFRILPEVIRHLTDAGYTKNTNTGHKAIQSY